MKIAKRLMLHVQLLGGPSLQLHEESHHQYSGGFVLGTVQGLVDVPLIFQ